MSATGKASEFQLPELLEDARYYEFSPLSEEEFQPNCSLENPFANVSRNDRIMGKLIDWTGSGLAAGKGGLGAGARRKSVSEEKEEELVDDWSLVMVEPSKGSAPQGRRPLARTLAGRRFPFRGGKSGGNYRSAPRTFRDPSVTVLPEWKLLEEIEFSRLAKLQFAPSQEPQVLVCIPDKVRSCDRNLLRSLSVKNEKPLGTLDINPVPSSLIQEDSQLTLLAKQHGAHFVTTDVAITALMSCSRSLLPWDLRIWQSDGIIFIDKRESCTLLDFPYVNENAEEAPINDKDHINGSGNLAVEAARINAKVPIFVSADTSEGSVVAHRYVLWNLGEDLKLLVRCQVNHCNEKGQVGIIRSLLEYEPLRAGDWRSRLDTQRAAIVANEAKNNAVILAKWLLGAVLADVAFFKLAFVSRISPKDRTRHSLLGVHEAEPYEAAFQLGIDVANSFGILKALCKQFCDLFASSPCESFVLLKDPNKPLLLLYSTISINSNSKNN